MAFQAFNDHSSTDERAIFTYIHKSIIDLHASPAPAGQPDNQPASQTTSHPQKLPRLKRLAIPPQLQQLPPFKPLYPPPPPPNPSKLPRLKVHHPHIHHHPLQTPHKLQVRRVPLKVKLPIFLILKLGHETVREGALTETSISQKRGNSAVSGE